MVPLVVSGILVYNSAQQGFHNESLQAAEQHAKETGQNVGFTLDDAIEQMDGLGNIPSIYEACTVGKTWNKTALYASYEGTKFGADNPDDDLAPKTGLNWNADNDPAPKGSEYLEEFINIHSEYVEIFVTDTRGYVVASMTSIPGDFDQAGEGWYEAVLADGDFTEYEFDESVGATVYTVSVKLTKGNEFFGVLKAAYNLDVLLEEFEEAVYYGDGFGFIGEKATDTIIGIKDNLLEGHQLSDYMSDNDIAKFDVQEAKSGSFFGKFQGKTYIVGYHTDADSSFYTIVLVPTSIFEGQLNTVLYYIVGLAVVVLILVAVFSVFFARTISKPITNLASVSKNIASGDLTQDLTQISSSTENEIGVLSSSFETMALNLKDTISKISTVAENLASSAQETASSSEEVNASSEEIASITQQISKGAQEQTTRIEESVKLATDLKKDFEEKIRNIVMASELIENLTSQVNMLALNASIEAARAGEYGRGFAVVAENVRTLADETKNSLTKVNEVIVDLQESTTTNIDVITTSIENVSSVAAETAAGSEEASAATEEQTATMEEMTASAQELAQLAVDLEEVVKQFQI
jgi:methyl-accepting chemotaxis protein